MNVTSLEEMEQIVAKNQTLSWDGWTVVQSKADPAGWTKPNGAIINNVWHTQKRFVPNENGWTIPSSFVR